MRAFWLVLLVAALPLTPVAAQDNDDSAPGSGGAESSPDDGGEKRIYKVPDGKGGYMFTDSPPEDGSAEEIKLKPGNSVPFKQPRMPQAASPEPETQRAETPDYRIRIMSPASEQTFQNPSEPIPVRADVTPPLRGGHRLEYYYDGHLLESGQIEWPDRGTHTLIVRVRNPEGEVVAESPVRTFYVHRASRLLP